jgi:hypothetical protein
VRKPRVRPPKAECYFGGRVRHETNGCGDNFAIGNFDLYRPSDARRLAKWLLAWAEWRERKEGK